MIEGIIYKATNVATGEVYIGATTIKLKERINDHYNKAVKDYGYKFQNAIREYGIENFTWEQIDTAQDPNELALKETNYITKFDSVNNGYNSDRGGGFKKLIYQFNIENGELVNSYDDLSSAAKSVNANYTSISNACLRYNKTCKGYIWSYSSTLELSSSFDMRKKRVSQISFDGNLVTNYESASEASRKTGISKSCITKCCRNERNSSGGYIWKYF